MIAIVAVTAMPYAAASALDDRKPSTSAMVATSERPVDARHVDLAVVVADVCRISTRGQ